MSTFNKTATLPKTCKVAHDAWMQSYEAYQKAMELDPKQAEAFMALRSYPVFDNYLELQREGNKFYNDKDYGNALLRYKQADQVGGERNRFGYSEAAYHLHTKLACLMRLALLFLGPRIVQTYRNRQAMILGRP